MHRSVKYCNYHVPGHDFSLYWQAWIGDLCNLTTGLNVEAAEITVLVKTMISYLLMTGLGLVLAFGAQYGDRSVMRLEPRLAEINADIPRIFFAAKVLGVMIAVVGLVSTAVTAFV